MELKPFHESIIGAIHSCLGNFYQNLSNETSSIAASRILCENLEPIQYLMERTLIPDDKLPELVSAISKITNDVHNQFKGNGSVVIEFAFGKIMETLKKRK